MQKLLSKEEVDLLLTEFGTLGSEEKKQFLLEHLELFAAINPRKLFYDEIVAVPDGQQSLDQSSH
jgi:hypothetical protein